jgi:hypothetical protein
MDNTFKNKINNLFRNMHFIGNYALYHKNRYILFPQLTNDNNDHNDFYEQLDKSNNNYNALISDLVSKNGFNYNTAQFYINTGQLSELHIYLRQNNIDINDYDNYFADYDYNVKNAYNRYFPNDQILEINQMLEINKKLFYEIDTNSFEKILEIRNYQINIYRVIHNTIETLYINIIKSQLSEDIKMHQADDLLTLLNNDIELIKAQFSKNYSNLVNNESYLLFNKYIENLQINLKNDTDILIKIKKIKYNTILDKLLIKEHLLREYGIRNINRKIPEEYGINDALRKNIAIHNDKLEKILEFCDYYDEIRKQNGLINFTNLTQFTEVLPDLANFDFEWILFWRRRIYPGVEFIVKKENQNQRDNIIFSQYNHPDEIHKPKNNILESYIDEHIHVQHSVLSDNYQMPVYGTEGSLIPFVYNTSRYDCLPFISKSHNTFYNYLFWSHDLNSFKLKLDLEKNKNKDTKMIVVFNEKRQPVRHTEYLKSFSKGKLKNLMINNIYLGYYFIPSTRNGRREGLPLFLFWDKTEMRFALYSLNASYLHMGVINDFPHVTYIELNQLIYKDVNIFKKPIKQCSDLQYMNDILYVTNSDTKELYTVDNKKHNAIYAFQRYKLCKDIDIETHKIDLQEYYFTLIPVNINDNEIKTQSDDVSQIKVQADNGTFSCQQKIQKRRQELKSPHQFQTGGKLHSFDIIKLNKVKEYYYEHNPKIMSKYGILFHKDILSIIRTTQNYDKYINILNPYEYLYPKARLYTHMIKRSVEKEYNIKNTNDILNTDNANLLYYKLDTNGSLFFWEINFQYQIINKHHRNLYEINNFSSIASIIPFIYDLILPDSKYQFTSINPLFLTAKEETREHHIERLKKLKRTTPKDNTEYYHAKSKNEYDIILDKIENIDFMFIDLYMYYGYLNIRPGSIFNTVAYLYTFINICDKFNDNATLCMKYCEIYSVLSVKVLTLISYMFEQYQFVKPDANSEKPTFVYVILKNFKRNENFIKELKNILKDDINIINTIALIKNYGRDTTLKIETILEKLITLFNINLFDQLDPLYKRLSHDIHKFNERNYFDFMYFLTEVKALTKLDKEGKLTEQFIQDNKKRNIFECIQWSKKYNFPLISLDDEQEFQETTKTKIFEQLVSYTNKIKFAFQANEKTLIQLSDNIDFDYIPSFFKKGLVKYKAEQKALQYRDTKLLKIIQKNTNNYYKEITKKLIKKYKLPNEHGNISFLKMIEILNQDVDLLPKKINSFHICEFPGSFINAIDMYTKNKIKNIKWEWKAQSLNPKEITIDQTLKLFDKHEENIIKKYPENYDFGKTGTGDITEIENILHYKNKYKNINFVTVDCVPLDTNSNKSQLSFCSIVTALSVLNEGGNGVFNRNLPIDNNQEIFLLYLLYLSFEKLIFYKPRIAPQSFEYYAIGINYNPKYFNEVSSKVYSYIKNYKEIGMIDISDVDVSFILQLDKIQNIIIDDVNEYIKTSIYFTDNFEQLSVEDLELINQTIDNKSDEWINKFL